MSARTLFARTALALAIALPAVASADSELDTLKQELARQRAQIEAQQKLLEKLSAALDAQQKAQATAAAGSPATAAGVSTSLDEDVPFGSSAPTATASNAKGGMGRGDTTIGGYGEVHLNHLNRGGSANTPTDNGNNLHLHRAVLLVGHKFSDTVSFNSEIEFENAPDSTSVETEVEQFYVDWRVRPFVGLKIGQWLTPVGILNERHEPDAFYGVERNPVETYIIPTTWWQKGVLAQWQLTPDLALDTGVSNGMNVNAGNGGIAGLATPNAEGMRPFRQEFGGASATHPAYTTRLRFTGINGLDLAATAQYQSDMSGNDVALPTSDRKAPALLTEAHADWRSGKFGLRVLGARWHIDNPYARLGGTDVMQGVYIEPTWRASEKLGLFVRHNIWNVAASSDSNPSLVQTNLGMNYWIAPQVVLKGDLQHGNTANRDSNSFNLGVGLSF